MSSILCHSFFWDNILYQSKLVYLLWPVATSLSIFILLWIWVISYWWVNQCMIWSPWGLLGKEKKIYIYIYMDHPFVDCVISYNIYMHVLMYIHNSTFRQSLVHIFLLNSIVLQHSTWQFSHIFASSMFSCQLDMIAVKLCKLYVRCDNVFHLVHIVYW